MDRILRVIRCCVDVSHRENSARNTGASNSFCKLCSKTIHPIEFKSHRTLLGIAAHPPILGWQARSGADRAAVIFPCLTIFLVPEMAREFLIRARYRSEVPSHTVSAD
jgi:hypothetical protein